MEKGIAKCIYAPQSEENALEVTAIVCDDINNDGVKEVIAGTAGGELLIFHAWGATYIRQWCFKLPGPIAQMYIGDINGDGTKELLAQIGGNFYAYQWQEHHYQEICCYCLGGVPAAWNCGDFDGDGTREVFVSYGNELALYRMDLQHHTEVWRQLLPGRILHIAVGDSDADGMDELTVAYLHAGKTGLIIYKWDGNDFVSQWEDSDAQQLPTALFIADSPQGLICGGIKEYSRLAIYEWTGADYNYVWISDVFRHVIWDGIAGTFWQGVAGITLASIDGEIYCGKYAEDGIIRWDCFALGCGIRKIIFGNCTSNCCREAIIQTSKGAIYIFTPLE